MRQTAKLANERLVSRRVSAIFLCCRKLQPAYEGNFITSLQETEPLLGVKGMLAIRTLTLRCLSKYPWIYKLKLFSAQLWARLMLQLREMLKPKKMAVLLSSYVLQR